MRLLVGLEAHFCQCGSEFYSPNLTYEGIWSRYLAVFEEILVVGRVAQAYQPPPQWIRTTGPGITIWPLPEYRGPWGYLKVRSKLQASIRLAVAQCDAYMLSVPGPIGTAIWAHLQRLGRPYGVEVVGDPWLSLAPGSVRSIVRPLARWKARRDLQRQCRTAQTALYVTERALQQAYPPGPDTCATGCSDVELESVITPEELEARLARIRDFPARLAGDGKPVRLGFVAALLQLYKAPDIHIQALAQCVKSGMNVELVLIGSGTRMGSMKALAEGLGVRDRIIFPGSLPGAKGVMDFLEGVDLFLNASRQEGLPRALVEALSRGCPAIGTDLAGIMELLPQECLVPVNDADALAQRIQELLQDPNRMASLAVQSVATASRYLRSVLDIRRKEHYAILRQRTLGLASG